MLAIFVSACVALWQTIERLIDPQELSHLGVLAAAGVIGFVGNEIAAQGQTLEPLTLKPSARAQPAPLEPFPAGFQMPREPYG